MHTNVFPESISWTHCAARMFPLADWREIYSSIVCLLHFVDIDGVGGGSGGGGDRVFFIEHFL